MKRLLECFFLIVFVPLCGCRSYVIDSNPQGLRVSVDNVELGFTPCEYTTSDDYFRIEVEPPSKQQLKKYQEEKQKIVSIWTTSAQSKSITLGVRSGSVFFQFIDSEYDIPKTEEEREWVLREIENDAENLKRKQNRD